MSLLLLLLLYLRCYSGLGFQRCRNIGMEPLPGKEAQCDPGRMGAEVWVMALKPLGSCFASLGGRVSGRRCRRDVDDDGSLPLTFDLAPSRSSKHPTVCPSKLPTSCDPLTCESSDLTHWSSESSSICLCTSMSSECLCTSTSSESSIFASTVPTTSCLSWQTRSLPPISQCRHHLNLCNSGLFLVICVTHE